MNPPPPGKARRGCMFYGCIISVVFMLMLLAGLLVGMRFAKRMITEFTESKPAEMPAVRLSQSEMDQVLQRANAFRDAIKAGKPAPPLILNSDEINGLIVTDPELTALKGKVYISTLRGDQVKAQVSFPMEEAGLPMFKNRYLNGDATFTVLFQNGMLRVSLRDINVKGKALPSVYMQKLKEQNWVRSSTALGKLQNVEVKDDKLIITAPPSTTPSQ